jgi:hypothetical protein
MIIPVGGLILLLSNVSAALVALVRIRSAARLRQVHEAMRYKMVSGLGPGSRVVDLDGIGMVIDIVTRANSEETSSVDPGLG